MKKIIAAQAIFFLAVSAIAALAVRPAFADTLSPATPSDSCAPSATDIAALQAIENNAALTPAQELSQELALRKKLLGQTISCATADAQTLQATLNAVATSGNGTIMQSQLSGKLDDALNFYSIETAKVNGSGISGTEAIAKEMLAWREANYVPLEGNVNNFILWSENQGLFATAQNRLTQTQRVVDFIENAAPTNNNLDANLQAAQSSLNDAESENTAAATAIMQLQDPDTTLALIQQSLQSLATAYQQFSDLNTLIQTLLPTSSQ